MSNAQRKCFFLHQVLVLLDESCDAIVAQNQTFPIYEDIIRLDIAMNYVQGGETM